MSATTYTFTPTANADKVSDLGSRVTDLESQNPVKSVNAMTPDADGNVDVETVDYAHNFVADDAQSSSGTFVTRTTGGDASLSDGDAWLNIVRGNYVHEGYSPRNVSMSVEAVERVPRTGSISVSIDRNTFVQSMNSDAHLTMSYNNGWGTDPSLYGITVTGVPVNGDSFTIDYTAEVLNMTVNAVQRQAEEGETAPEPITATINRSTFISYVSASTTITLTYTDSWSADPTLYGITVSGTPVEGDSIVVVYVKEVIESAVTMVETVVRENVITAGIDEEAFDNAVNSNVTMTFSYTNGDWNLSPLTYGITVSGVPVNGDVITVTCTKEVRGTIHPFKPETFYSTGWNLYNNTLGYARTIKYHSTYGFILGGTFTSAKFSTSNDPDAQKTTLALVDQGDGTYYFEVAEDGFVWLEGADSTTTYILMTWSDWQAGPPDGFKAHESSVIDLSSVMDEYFPNGMMRIGTIYDEINVPLQTIYSRIERLTYSYATLVTIKNSGREYIYDNNYIYVVKEEVDSYTELLDGLYTANDHGLEVFTGTDVPGHAQMLYGQNLKDKLRTDVVTISSQDLTAQQKKSVRNNIGAAATVNGVSPDSNGNVVLPTDSTPTNQSQNYVTSGGVYAEISAINQRIGNVESPASVFQDVSFSIPLTAWTGSSSFTATVSNTSITSTSGIWVFYDSTYTSYANAPISAMVESGGGGVVFTTATKPTAAISGYIRIVDSVNGIIPIERGGTAAGTAAAARTNLGLGAAATKDVANNLITESAGGSVLDAYQGKLLNDAVTTLNDRMTPEFLDESVVGTFNGATLYRRFFNTPAVNIPTGSDLKVITGLPTHNHLAMINVMFVLTGSSIAEPADAYLRFYVDNAGNGYARQNIGSSALAGVIRIEAYYTK